ncbi:MAG: acyl-CoA synthetase FdrA [Lachnoclostridium edouardi]|uniref:acyl-CoA synthetase FdrA n=1 Tax=Lachnoclostridium edouardi TaxID=1926283 RepID=UPI0026DBD726|nr:acyl-CoA synthetase FdrA [Lachnoclostridium edouardi]MDO4278231.1 acyl-CoA synthetase FdrA [Lachnoclostridium edouardi]
MPIRTIIKKNTYFDSVSLMTLSTRANSIEGVKQVNVAMGTAMNKDVLKNVGLYTEEAEAAGKGDLMIVVESQEGYDLDELVNKVEEAMMRKNKNKETADIVYSSVEAAVQENENANLAVISVPGAYAARVARKALNQGLHVMMFSDNVSLEEEISLKKEAHEKGLFVMGPDCGTAIINGQGLCFANKIRKGKIGIVAASGTGAQEVSVRIHDFGGGVSQLIGTGGRDLSEAVGGIMMLDGMRALAEDEGTEIIVLVSKPPAKAVAEKIYKEVKKISKPVVICFIGGNKEEIEASGAYYGKTTKQAALQAVILSGVPEETINKHALNLPLIEEVKAKLNPQQKYIRGLFCGGTICEEVTSLVREKYSDVYSNLSKDPAYKLSHTDESRAHTFIDFGDDQFTQGKPHPMIEPSLRLERIVKEARDPEVGVIALDIILGYGSHEDPVEVTLPAIREAKAIAAKEGRHIEILGFVLGTELDPQDFDLQVKKLMDAGVTISSSSENTGLLSRGFVEKEEA